MYARIKDNKVVDLYTELPKTLENVSGLSALPPEKLLEMGIVAIDETFAVEIPKEVGDKILAQKKMALLRAMYLYQSQYMDHGDMALIVLGAMQGDAACIAIAKWYKELKIEYYRRVDALVAEGDINTDFSLCGPMPSSITEALVGISLE